MHRLAVNDSAPDHPSPPQDSPQEALSATIHSVLRVASRVALLRFIGEKAEVQEGDLSMIRAGTRRSLVLTAG